MPASTTPTDVSVTPRIPQFDFQRPPKTWLKDDVASHFFNALSLYVPASEKLVIQILRELLSETEGPLHEQIKAVIQQEGQHARLHRQTNQWLLKGYPNLRWAVRVQEQGYRVIAWLLPKASIPAAFEHFTSALAKYYLKDTEAWTGKQHNELTRFLDWHVLEELEHQSVCLDAYRVKYPQSRWLLPLSLSHYSGRLLRFSPFMVHRDICSIGTGCLNSQIFAASIGEC